MKDEEMKQIIKPEKMNLVLSNDKMAQATA